MRGRGEECGDRVLEDWFAAIGAGCQLSAGAARALLEDGFAVIAGPVAAERWTRFTAAYDRAMEAGSGQDLAIGSTTTRLYDFVNRGAEFDELYIYGPLLEACCRVIGSPFKLSSSLGRTLRAHGGAQELHVDIARDSDESPMVGFILMVDDFGEENGATRFVPGSHRWAEAPGDGTEEGLASCEVLVCGRAGSLIVFNAAIWHGHTANRTGADRRSVQGYFVRREVRSGIDLAARMQRETLERMGPLARYVLAV